MRYQKIDAQNFRRFSRLSFEPHPRFSVITGDNAAGKTTILEALYVAARGESHRGALSQLPRDGGSDFGVEALVTSQPSVPSDRINIDYRERRLAIRVNDAASGLADLVRRMPVLVLDPQSHQLVEQGPGVRRKFIDWGVFHMEQNFLPVWRRFNRALKQRNAALRAGVSAREIESWTPELAATASLLTEQRQAWLCRLSDIVPDYWRELVGDSTWSFELRQGWRDDECYADTLARTLDGDRSVGHTREGPHRAELRLLGDNRGLRERISRGQQKLLVAGLTMAQAELYRQQHGDTPVLLIDDVAAELSTGSQSRLLSVLSTWPGQSIVTTLQWEPNTPLAEHAMFHVEHGVLTMKNTI